VNSRYFTRVTRVAGISALGLGVGLALSACNPGASSAVSAPAVTATSAMATAAAAASTAARGAALVPMQTAAGGEFVSPSGNISCEVDYHRAGLTQVYCQTATPPRSVTMGVGGKYKTCAGEQCLGNSGTGTPTLAYGRATGVGPFRCESAAAGVTCVAGGRGFRISASGMTAVSA
jgi:hypothetical protein